MNQPKEATVSAASARPLTLAMDYVALTKPAIMSLLIFTMLGAMMLAYGGMPPWHLVLWAIVGGAFSSGGASAINHSMDRDIDQIMARTRHRPVADERVSPARALAFGILLNAAAFAVFAIAANLLSAVLALSGALFYIFVYTAWLKRSSTQNIVIGGAAGAFPPLVGWAAVTGSLSLPAWYMFTIIFFWTPPHFWALSLLLKKDYEAAKVPMFPVVFGERETQIVIFLYTVTVVLVTLLFYLSTSLLGWVYLAAALALGGAFIWYAAILVRRPTKLNARRMYLYSLLYLAAVFLAIMIDGSLS